MQTFPPCILFPMLNKKALSLFLTTITEGLKEGEGETDRDRQTGARGQERENAMD